MLGRDQRVFAVSGRCPAQLDRDAHMPARSAQHVGYPDRRDPIGAAPTVTHLGQAPKAQNDRRQSHMNVIAARPDIAEKPGFAGDWGISGGLGRVQQRSRHGTAFSIRNAAQRVAKKPTPAAISGISSGHSHPQP